MAPIPRLEFELGVNSIPKFANGIGIGIDGIVPVTGFYYSLGAIARVTLGWKWHLVRDKNYFIFFTQVTVIRSLVAGNGTL